MAIERLLAGHVVGDHRLLCAYILPYTLTYHSNIKVQLRPKPAYYAIARELAPFTIGISRTVRQRSFITHRARG